MTWQPDKPANDAIRVSDEYLRENFAEIEDAYSATHVFPGSAGTRGTHIPGQVPICEVAAESVLSALTETPGALVWGTDLEGFWTGTAVAATYDSRSFVEDGTVAIFFQAAAPNGWTIVQTIHDSAIIVTSAGVGNALTGGAAVANGTWAMSGITWSHTHGMTQVPYHRHSMEISYATLQPQYGYGTRGQGAGLPAWALANVYTSTDGDSPANTTATNTVLAGDGTWRPQSIITILAEKD